MQQGRAFLDPWDALTDTNTTFDVLVVGGGIHGTSIARDAALRGLAVALVEAKDWGWGTTAKSSRLAHGGLRYLEQFEFGLVHEALQDRERFLRHAPHHVRPLRFLYPLYPDVASRHTVGLGLTAYDILSHGKSLPNHQRLDVNGALTAAPGLEAKDLRGAATFWDAQIQHVERLVAEQVEHARELGAVCGNGVRVVGFERDATRVTGAVVAHEDGRAGRIRARTVINATGAWVDATLGALAAGRPPKVRLTKGVHVVVPRFTKDALLVKSRRDGRTFFVLPWHEHCILGTTDTDYVGDAGDAAATAADVRYLVEETRRYFPEAPVDDVDFTFAGVRALVNQPGLAESRVTRRHILYDHGPREGLAGLWTLQGGKITTSRSLAEATVDAVCQHLGRKDLARVRPTRTTPYPRAPTQPWEDFVASAANDAVARGVAPRHAAAFVQRWGAGWSRVWDVAGAAGQERIPGGDHFACEVLVAVREQQARHLADVMLRRTTLGLARDGNPAATDAVLDILAAELGWDHVRRTDELASYQAELRTWAVPR